MLISTPDAALALIAILPGKKRSTSFEIDATEAAMGARFPARFRQLLEITGGDTSWLFPDGFGPLSELHGFQEFLAEVSDVYRPTAHDVAFDQFHAQVVYFFRADGTSEDPEVHRIFEGGSPQPTGLTFGLYVTMTLEQYLDSAAAL